MTKRYRVGIIYGGQSGEHEISLVSAYWIMHHLDKTRFEPVAMGIDKTGHFWLTENTEDIIDSDKKILKVKAESSKQISTPSKDDNLNLDVVFPAIHGPLYEDGHLQGALTLAEIPFAGPEMTTCAIAMDKVLSKQIAQMNGVPVVPWDIIHKAKYTKEKRDETLDRVMQHLGLPVVVKPSNLGSSVGISFAETKEELIAAVEEAFRFDKKLLIEKAVAGHELEVAALQSLDAPGKTKVTLPGEIIVSEKYKFYSYDAKYNDPDGASEVIPANVPEALQQQCQSYAKAIFKAFDSTGMARIDFLYDKATETLYFNEFNPIPGFTPISLYPKMWANEGIDFQTLVSHLLDAALLNAENRKSIDRCYHS